MLWYISKFPYFLSSLNQQTSWFYLLPWKGFSAAILMIALICLQTSWSCLRPWLWFSAEIKVIALILANFLILFPTMIRIQISNIGESFDVSANFLILTHTLRRIKSSYFGNCFDIYANFLILSNMLIRIQSSNIGDYFDIPKTSWFCHIPWWVFNAAILVINLLYRQTYWAESVS